MYQILVDNTHYKYSRKLQQLQDVQNNPKFLPWVRTHSLSSGRCYTYLFMFLSELDTYCTQKPFDTKRHVLANRMIALTGYRTRDCSTQGQCYCNCTICTKFYLYLRLPIQVVVNCTKCGNKRWYNTLIICNDCAVGFQLELLFVDQVLWSKN